MARDRADTDEAPSVEKMKQIFDQLSASPKGYGTVVGETTDVLTHEKRYVIGDGKQFTEVQPPAHGTVAVGDVVTLLPQTGQIVGKSPTRLPGLVGSVDSLRGVDRVMVDIKGDLKMAFLPEKLAKIKPGHRVALDPSGSVVVEDLGSPGAKHARFGTKVTWDDIGGALQAKRDMREAIEDPHLFRELYGAYHQRPAKGIELYGPPGCGKTMLGKAAATALATIYKATEDAANSCFMYIKGPEILDKYVGESERAIRDIFARARAHQQEYGFPAVVFIDDAESILSKRGSGVSSDVDKTIVPAFLIEMDGLDESGAFVILATNRPDRLDPAVVRDERMDCKVRVPRPEMEDFANILRLNLRGKPLARKVDVDDIAETVAAEVYSDSHVVHKTQKDNKKVELRLRNIASGAMATNLVNRAVREAIRRDKESKRSAVSGVSYDDFMTGIGHAVREAKHVDHTDDVAAYLEDQHHRDVETDASAAPVARRATGAAA